MTGPYAASTPTLLAGAHRQDGAVRATHPDWPGPVALDVEDLSIGWDETRAPRCTATVTIPATEAVLVDLNPLAGVRLQVDAGYIAADGTRDVHTVADLGLRSRTVNRPDGRVTLTASSDEALAIDGAPTYQWTASGFGSTAAAITHLLDVALGPHVPTVLTSGTLGPPVAQVGPTDDLFDTVKDLADRIGADVYDDGTRTWRLQPRPVVAGTPDAVLTVGPAGTITDAASVLARDDWYDHVLLVYKWRADDTDHVLLGQAYSTLTGGAKRYTETRTVATTQADATAAAVALVRRLVSRSRQLRVTAIAAWWLRPGMTVDVQLPTGDLERHLVSAVDFDATRALMTVTTRLPPNVTIEGE